MHPHQNQFLLLFPLKSLGFLFGLLVVLFLFEKAVGVSFYLSTILSFHKQWMTFPVGSEKGGKKCQMILVCAFRATCSCLTLGTLLCRDR